MNNNFHTARYFISGYKKISLAVAVLCVISCIHVPVFSQSFNETGYYPVYNFSSITYNAQEQNLAITEDNRGLLYFANPSGVLEYDGVNWRTIKLTGEKRARSVSADSLGRVFVGSENELGYLSPDSIGNLVYISLMSSVPEEYNDFKEVWNVYSKGNEVYFQTDKFILVWNGVTMRVIPFKAQILAFLLLDNEAYIQIENIGLTRLKGDSSILIPKGEEFAKKKIYGIFKPDSLSLVIGQGSGFKIVKQNTDKGGKWSISPFFTKVDKYLADYGVYNVRLFNHDKIAIGTWGGGLVVINLKGELEYIVDSKFGLQDLIIQQQFLDSKGNIWLALSKGISRVEVQNPISVFTSQNGLQGTIQSITRFNKRIFAATDFGLFYMDFQAKGLMGDKGMQAVFKPFDKISGECWDLHTFEFRDKEILLVVTNDGVSAINENGDVNSILKGIAFDVYQSKLDPARIYVGLEDGLKSLYYHNGIWEPEKKIRGLDECITNIAEDFLGNLWMGTEAQGIVKMNIKSFTDKRIDSVKISRFDTLQGLPRPIGPTLVTQVTQRLIIGTNKGIYKYQALQDTLVADTSFGDKFAINPPIIHRISQINDNEIWMTTIEETDKISYHIGYLKHLNSNKYEWISQPFIRISESIQHAIYLDDGDGIVWFGGPNGLFRYDGQLEKNYNSDYYTLIRKVTLSDGDTIFKGTGYDEAGNVSYLQPDKLVPELPYSLNSLTFEFAAQSGEDESGLSFSYMLEGYDKKWSEWASQSSKEYTNLNEGSYIMRVKARNFYEHEGIEAAFSFYIDSPWYRTVWAYISYIILLAVFIFGIVKVYTRNLREIIRERTAEVVKQKDEIEEKNKEITDSIHYASKIQRAILPPEELISGILSDYFILYMPRDIVSGDFYWINSDRNRLITVAADCTGHGVPGAFMSMLGSAFLNEIVKKNEKISSDEILNQLRFAIIKSLRQTGKEGENKDGMDIALCVYDLENMKLQYSGANNPLYLIRNEEIIVYTANKMPIGIHVRVDEPFTLNEIDLIKGDLFYSFSDGYIDQFGGPDGKKFLSKQFREYLLTIHKENMTTQKQLLKEKIVDWMKNTTQIDDILVMGIKI